MAGFRLNSLLGLRRIQEGQAAARLAEAQRSVGAERGRAARERALLEEHGGVHSLAAAGIARSTAARQLAEIRAAESAASGQVQDAEEALRLAVQARRSAELLRERHDLMVLELEGRAEQQALDELAATAHHRKSTTEKES